MATERWSFLGGDETPDVKLIERFAVVQAWRRLARPAERVRTEVWEGGSGSDVEVLARAAREIGFMNAALIFEGHAVPICAEGRPMVPVLDLDLAQSHQPDRPFPETGRLQIWVGEGFFEGGADIDRVPGNGYFEIVYIPITSGLKPVEIHYNATRRLFRIAQLESFHHHMQPAYISEFIEFFPDLADAWNKTSKEELFPILPNGHSVGVFDMCQAMYKVFDREEWLDHESTSHGGAILGGWPRFEQWVSDEYGGLDTVLSITLYEWEGNHGCCYVNFSGNRSDLNAGDFSRVGYDIQA